MLRQRRQSKNCWDPNSITRTNIECSQYNKDIQNKTQQALNKTLIVKCLFLLIQTIPQTNVQ